MNGNVLEWVIVVLLVLLFVILIIAYAEVRRFIRQMDVDHINSAVTKADELDVDHINSAITKIDNISSKVDDLQSKISSINIPSIRIPGIG